MTAETCATHPTVTLVQFCPACRASIGGKKGSPAQAAARRTNGAKGGRPKKKRPSPAKPLTKAPGKS